MYVCRVLYRVPWHGFGVVSIICPPDPHLSRFLSPYLGEGGVGSHLRQFPTCLVSRRDFDGDGILYLLYFQDSLRSLPDLGLSPRREEFELTRVPSRSPNTLVPRRSCPDPPRLRWTGVRGPPRGDDALGVSFFEPVLLFRNVEGLPILCRDLRTRPLDERVCTRKSTRSPF